MASLLQNMGGGIHGIVEMLLELSVTELEDVAINTDTSWCPPQPLIQESLHPYTDHVRIPGAEANCAGGLTLTAPSMVGAGGKDLE